MSAAGRFGRGAIALLVALGGCDRGDPRSGPPTGQLPKSTPQSALVPGLPQPRQPSTNPYSGNAAAIAEGERLYNWFNCSGCHSQGGGGMGPPLMDDKWIYGREPANLFSVIVEGRSGGMPAFGGHIPERQIWQIIAFIETMGGMTREKDDAAAGGETGLAPAARGPGMKAQEGDTTAADSKDVESGARGKVENDPSAIGKGRAPER